MQASLTLPRLVEGGSFDLDPSGLWLTFDTVYHIKQLVNKNSKKKQKEIPRTSVDLVALRLSCTGIRSQGFIHYSLTLFQLSYRGLIYHLMAFVIMVSTV